MGEQLLNRLVFRIGTRYNRSKHEIDRLDGALPAQANESWNQFLWSAGIRYNRNARLSVYSNIGASFRAPSLKSVGGTIPLSDRGAEGVSGHLPNPDLDPESGVSVDLGANCAVTDGLSLGVRGFLIHLDDQIVQNVVNDLQSQDINAGRTRTWGAEAEISHDLAAWCQWRANYTLTRTEIDNDVDPDQDGAEVNFVPQHMGNVGADLLLPGGLAASISVQLSSSINESVSRSAPRGIDGHELVNARIEKLFAHADGREVRLYLEPYNITNNDFRMPWGFKDTGFSATGGLTVSF